MDNGPIANWKNGIKYMLATAKDANDAPSAMAVSGTDVYVTRHVGFTACFGKTAQALH